jgi:methylenetetrahydrofolate reductase (NADPH)
MNVDSKFAKKLTSSEFIVTAEYLPKAGTSLQGIDSAVKGFGSAVTAVNVADNIHSIGMSSIAASVAVLKAGAEPICQMITRDRNRIAIQSDLLGGAYLGIKNLLCLSGYHQTLSTSPESANTYDIDSTQLIDLVTTMSEKGTLADGTKIDGPFSMLAGAAANPFLKPLELSMLRLNKKVEAGAKFVQTSPVFDMETFGKWHEYAVKEGIVTKAPILAGVLALESAAEAERLRKTYTDYVIPEAVIDRLKKAGDEAAQKKEGVNIALETIKKLKNTKALRGIHIHCGGTGAIAPELIAAASA